MNNDVKERVREANNIVSLVSEFTTLKRSGSRLKGLCPLPGHVEKTPSFTVSEELGLYYCYGCSRGGDIFSFISEIKSFNFKEALAFLANKAGITIQKTTYTDKTYSKLLEINSLASEYFRKNLNKLPLDHPVKVYLKKRGILDMTKEFDIGLATDSWTGLLDYLSNHDLKLVESLGLIRKNKSNNYYDLFRNRIIFPIKDSGKVLGFGGRTIVKDDPVKYLNSPESKLFYKKKILYGTTNAISSIRRQDMVILVEGYMDVVSMHKHGFQNTVGIMGTGLTDEQASAIKKYTKNVVLLFDSDKAGIMASVRALPVLLKAGLYPKILKLPCKDPDETLQKKGTEWLRDNMGQSEDLFKWLLIDKMKTSNSVLTVYDREKIFNEMIALREFVSDQSLMYSYDKMLEEILEIPRHVVTSKGFKNRFHPRSFVKAESDKVSITPKHELMLASILLLKPEYILKLGEIEDWLSCKSIIQIVKKLQNLSGHDKFSIDTLISSLELKPDGLIESIMDLSSNLDTNKLEELFSDCIVKLKARFLKQKSKLVLSNINRDNRDEKLRQFSKIQAERHGLSRQDIK